jgi:purine-binding chemotaxis protein CheW
MKPTPRPPIDWESVRARLARNFAGEREIDHQAILAARARRYAEAHQFAEREATREYLCFGVSGERYAVEARYVVEVASRELTPVPGAPARLLGLANLRGEILPVFDLPRSLGREQGMTTGDGGHLVVLGLAQPELAFFARSLEGVVPLAEREILSEPGRFRGQPAVLGVTSQALIVLAGGALLDSDIFMLDASGYGPRTSVEHLTRPAEVEA